ncbi:unnamed protein product [Lampetra fluviatilis]
MLGREGPGLASPSGSGASAALAEVSPPRPWRCLAKLHRAGHFELARHEEAQDAGHEPASSAAQSQPLTITSPLGEPQRHPGHGSHPSVLVPRLCLWTLTSRFGTQQGEGCVLPTSSPVGVSANIPTRQLGPARAGGRGFVLGTRQNPPPPGTFARTTTTQQVAAPASEQCTPLWCACEKTRSVPGATPPEVWPTPGTGCSLDAAMLTTWSETANAS